jgi:hypothetical protein
VSATTRQPLPWYVRRLDYRSKLDGPAAGVLWDGSRATRREDTRAIWAGRQREAPYTRASQDGQDGVPFDPDRMHDVRLPNGETVCRYRYGSARWDVDGLRDAWEAGDRWRILLRNGGRQDAARAAVQRGWGRARKLYKAWRRSRRRRR